MMIGGRLCLPPPNGHTRRHDTLTEIYAIPKESFLRRYGKRIAGGLACAAVVSVIMHLWYVKLAILWVCQIILLIFGRPAGFDKIPVIKQQARQAIVKGGEIIRDHKPALPKVAAPPAPKAKVIAPIVASAVAVPVVKKIEAIEKKIEKREEKLANAIHDGADSFRKGTGKIEAAIRARRAEKAEEKYSQLIVRARSLGIKTDDSWSLARLEAEVSQAEDAIWKRRYNAQCPYCHHPLRIRDSGKRERFGCLWCHNIFSGGTARALGAPPRTKPGWRLPF